MGPLQGLEELQERIGCGKSPLPRRNVSLGSSGMEFGEYGREWLDQHLQSEAKMDNLRPKQNRAKFLQKQEGHKGNYHVLPVPTGVMGAPQP